MQPDTIWSLFLQGAAVAETRLGAEVRDYDRLLEGIAAILKATGITVSEYKSLMLELHGRYFNTLSHLTLPASVADLIQAVAYLDAGLLRWSEEPPMYMVSDVIKGELHGPFSPYYLSYLSPRVNEAGVLREKIAAMRKELHAPSRSDGLPDGGPLYRQLHNTRAMAGAFNRSSDLVWAISEALTSGAERKGVMALRDLAQRYLKAADALEARGLAAIAEAEARQKAIPVEAGESLLAFSSLPGRVKKSYRNQAGEGRFASNGAWMADLEAVPDDKTRATLVLGNETKAHMQAAAAKVWDLYTSDLQPAQVLGMMPLSLLVILAKGEGALIAVDGELLAWLWRTLGPDTVMIGQSVVALMRAGKPVAAVAIERRPGPEEMDPEAARRKAATLPPLPAPKKKQVRKAARPAMPPLLVAEEASVCPS